MAELRVVDAGRVDAWRSQSLWHGIAEAMGEHDRPTLSFCVPADPYVGLGYHHPLAALDLDHCRGRGLPVIRRQIGGGAVWIDSGQLFFQLTLPAGAAPRRVDRLYRLGLSPAVTALRRLGLDARLRGRNDIAVGDRKVSGTGAGRIGGGVTVVGNVIFRFPHRRMAAVLALDQALRREYLRLLRRHVSSLAAEGLPAVTPRAARQALVAAYAESLSLAPVAGALGGAELAAIGRWEDRFRDPHWLRDRATRPRRGSEVKVAAGVWLLAAGDRRLAVRAAVVDGRFDRLTVSGSRLNGATAAIERALAGAATEPGVVAERLRPFGATGRGIRRLLAPALGREKGAWT